MFAALHSSAFLLETQSKSSSMDFFFNSALFKLAGIRFSDDRYEFDAFPDDVASKGIVDAEETKTETNITSTAPAAALHVDFLQEEKLEAPEAIDASSTSKSLKRRRRKRSNSKSLGKSISFGNVDIVSATTQCIYHQSPSCSPFNIHNPCL